VNVRFSEASASELQDAVSFYAAESKLLAQSFKSEVSSAIRRIVQFPKGWSEEADGIRKCLLRKFPYKVLYSIEKEDILILAVAHQHRRPEYWLDR